MGRALHRIPMLGVVVAFAACGGRSSLLDSIPDDSVHAAGGADAGVPRQGTDADVQRTRDGSVRDGAMEGGSGNDAGKRMDATAVVDAPADSAKDTGTSATTGDGACVRLGMCCPSIGEPLQSVCVQVAKMGNVVGCALFLEDGSPKDICPPGSGTEIGGPACVALGACCSMVPSAEVQACVAVANQADDSECAGAVALGQSAGQCLLGDGGSGGADGAGE
jgi:hypothetical protein